MFLKCIVVFTAWNGYVVYTFDDDVMYRKYLNYCYDGEDRFIEGIFDRDTEEIYHETTYELRVMYMRGVHHNQSVF